MIAFVIIALLIVIPYAILVWRISDLEEKLKNEELKNIKGLFRRTMLISECAILEKKIKELESKHADKI